ncbi:helix-turn-helix domain-containing protein [Aliidiomarina celeris]|uniref:helix-turn-helix domain-containing protein n=1 Tax=Aliidiomarina celeris TaxID=2249428 RepID=UPI000DEB4A0C|nr:helix-turn-helix transcriptional regulator [Aliidiomarina celeris]
MIIHTSVVKEARTQRGWTQQQLAEVTGLSLRTIQRVESQGQASVETCNALCAVLEITRDELLVNTAERRSSPYSTGFVVAILAAVGIGFASGVVLTLVLQ